MSTSKPSLERFEEKHVPEPNTGCWLWTGAYSGDNPMFWLDSRVMPAARAALRLRGVDIAAELDVRMRCGTRACVNPEHVLIQDRDRTAQRFWSHVQPNDQGCWTWTGRKNRGGYGILGVGQTTAFAHRWSYEFHRGTIPVGLQLDHLCRNRACVNPAHLEPVTPRENTRRSPRANLTRCKRGHAFIPSNTYHHRGRRHCRTCRSRKAES